MKKTLITLVLALISSLTFAGIDSGGASNGLEADCIFQKSDMDGMRVYIEKGPFIFTHNGKLTNASFLKGSSPDEKSYLLLNKSYVPIPVSSAPEAEFSVYKLVYSNSSSTFKIEIVMEHDLAEESNPKLDATLTIVTNGEKQLLFGQCEFN